MSFSQSKGSDCFLGEIIESIVTSNHSHELEEKWIDLALSLETKNDTLKNVRRNSTNRDSSLADILETILLEWKIREGSNATVEKLVNALEEIHKDLADELKLKVKNNLNRTFSLTRRPLSLAIGRIDYSNIEEKPLVSPVSQKSQFCEEHSCLDCVQKYKHNSRAVQQIYVPEAKNYKTSSTSWTKNFLVGVVSGTVTSLVLIITLLIFRNYSSEPSTDTPLFNGALQPSQLLMSHHSTEAYTILPTTFTLSTCMRILITSPDKYHSELDGIPPTRPICLVIDISNNTEWNYKKLDFGQTERIIELQVRGNIQLNLLENILQIMPHVELVHIVNNNNAKCDDSLETWPSDKIKLDKLKYLIIDGFVTCEEIFTSLSSNFLMTKLTSLEIRNSRISARNKKSMHEFLRHIRRPLKGLTFSNTAFDTSPFQNFSFVLNDVEEMHMDFITSLESITYLGNTFASRLPKIRKFTSSSGTLQLHELHNLLKLPNLEILENIGVHIPKGTCFNKNETDKASDTLNYVKLKLHFEDSEDCAIRQNHKRQLKPYIISHNCKNPFE